MKDLAYVVASLLVITAYIAIPYALLANAKGMELFAFWTAATILWSAVSLLHLRKKR